MLNGGRGLDALSLRQQINATFAWLWEDGKHDGDQRELLLSLKVPPLADNGLIPKELVGMVPPPWFGDGTSGGVGFGQDMASGREKS